ncbi:Dihydroorotase [Micractinium conductrix]|uniref:dihydropyrimidinase n=1 Tax=Micractinium conductrix TaxID=554055 RepID=A0A2P6VMI1_9CHLO|nr:Dihydroorotase [Micractinium conductrix]|eukprot:PSC75311.1 Dihydroorotase [Micractinium conductrix]
MRAQHLAAALALVLLACGAAGEDILIKGGTVVNADRQFQADVLIRGGLIARVGPNLQAERQGTRTLSAAGRLVMPGGIDPHTHLSMPFMGQVTCDDFFSGHAAALAGGTTMHVDFALPVDHDLLAGWDAWQRKAADGVMDYGFHMAVTSWSDKVAADMGTLTKMGVNSFKFFMAYKGALMVNDEQLLQALRRCKELGAVPQVHAENGDAVAEGQARVFAAGITGPEGHALSRPAALEGEATARAIRLAQFVGAPLYVVHVMSRDAAEEVARARQRGQRVVGETVASAIACDESSMWDADFTRAAAFVMSPPIRSKEHQAALQGALAGGLLQLVGTDHAVFNSSQKAAGRHDFRIIPNGVNGLEERLHVVWTELVASGKLAPTDFVRVTSTAAAHIFNVYPRKGLIAKGSDADVIIFDPALEHTLRAAAHHSALDTNIYEGYKARGKVLTTISRGRLVWHEGRLNITRGSGRFVPTPTHGPLYAGLDAVPEHSLFDVARYGGVPVRRAGDAPASGAARDEL